MRLEPALEGGFVIDALGLGPLLEVDPPGVPELMRESRITSRFERGEGEDEGRFRVTFLYLDIMVRLIVNAEGAVLRQSRVRGAPGG